MRGEGEKSGKAERGGKNGGGEEEEGKGEKGRGEKMNLSIFEREKCKIFCFFFFKVIHRKQKL